MGERDGWGLTRGFFSPVFLATPPLACLWGVAVSFPRYSVATRKDRCAIILATRTSARVTSKGAAAAPGAGGGPDLPSSLLGHVVIVDEERKPSFVFEFGRASGPSAPSAHWKTFCPCPRAG
jgi:hypothetical protein